MLSHAERHGRIFLTVTAFALLPACTPDQRVTAPNMALSAAREIDDVGANVGDEVQWSAWSTPQNLGATINTSALEQHPAISKDGLSLYFASDRAGGFGGVDIYVSQRSSLDAPWGTPVNLGPKINSGRNESAPTFSSDGHSMYFHSNGRGGCGGADLFVSHRRHRRNDFGWEQPQNLGCLVNSKSADNGPTIFEDDATGITTLYFNSTRPGGLGDADIYASTRIGDEGEFGQAVLVRELSSPFRDTRTAISRDGLEMFLSSGRDGGIGSEDIWVSTRATALDRWSTPVNLGTTVNTAAFDGGPALSFDGTTLYFHSDRQGPPGNYDIWVTTRTRVRK